MATAIDYRTSSFDVVRVRSAGQHIGRNVYWKLYAVENAFRVVVHSVLNAQIGAQWWTTAADKTLQRKVQRRKADYAAMPWHTSPGKHELYYLDLADLNEIFRANKNLFLPAIPDIDQWLERIEQIRLPRNVVAHMNWPSNTDKRRIDVFYSDVQALLGKLGATVSLMIP